MQSQFVFYGKERLLDFARNVNGWAQTHEKALFWLLGLAYKISLDIMYVFAASPMYQTEGLVLDFVAWKHALSFAMYMVLFFLFPKTEKDSVNFLFHFQLAFIIAPMLTFYAFSNGSTAYMCATVICVVLQAVILRAPHNSKTTIKIVGVKGLVVAGILAMTVYSVLGMIWINGFEGMKAFDIEYIYEMRENMVYPFGVGYFINLLTKAVIPFALLYGIKSRKYWLPALCVVAQLVFFVITGQKFVLLVLAPVVVIYLCAKTGHLIKLLYLGLTGVSLVVTIGWLLQGDVGGSPGYALCMLYAVRAIFHPADNKFNFFECFNELPKTYFSDGQIGKMFGLTYPYQGSLGQVMYAWCDGTFLEANFNAGYLADAYAQLGFLGMIMVALLIALLLRPLRSYDRFGFQDIIVALFSVYVIMLNDGPLFTVLLTGGLLIAYGLVFVFLDTAMKGPKHGIQN